MGQFNGNELHRNNGGGSFTKITSPFTAGVAGDYTYAVAWGDMDGDGDLVRRCCPLSTFRCVCVRVRSIAAQCV